MFSAVLFSAELEKRHWDKFFQVPKPNLRIKRIGNACHSSDSRQPFHKRSLEQFHFSLDDRENIFLQLGGKSE
jgi:hypothetical protein